MPEYAVGENSGGAMVADIGKLSRSAVFWLKVTELLLIFVMIGLAQNGGFFVGNMSKSFVVFGTIFAYIIINAIMIVAFVMDEAFSKRITMVLTCLAGVLFITAGALLIEYWDQVPDLRFNDYSLGAGILGLIIGIIYLVDTAYTFKFD